MKLNTALHMVANGHPGHLLLVSEQLTDIIGDSLDPENVNADIGNLLAIAMAALDRLPKLEGGNGVLQSLAIRCVNRALYLGPFDPTNVDGDGNEN